MSIGPHFEIDEDDGKDQRSTFSNKCYSKTMFMRHSVAISTFFQEEAWSLIFECIYFWSWLNIVFLMMKGLFSDLWSFTFDLWLLIHELMQFSVLSSLNKLQPPPEILASTISFVSLEDGELSKEMATCEFRKIKDQRSTLLLSFQPSEPRTHFEIIENRNVRMCVIPDQYELADTGVWVCTKHFTREELAAFAGTYFPLKICYYNLI